MYRSKAALGKKQCRLMFVFAGLAFPIQKLKQTQKSLATMTLDHNQLLVRVRECEAQLAIAQSAKVCSSPNKTDLEHPASHYLFLHYKTRE